MSTQFKQLKKQVEALTEEVELLLKKRRLFEEEMETLEGQELLKTIHTRIVGETDLLDVVYECTDRLTFHEDIHVACDNLQDDNILKVEIKVVPFSLEELLLIQEIRDREESPDVEYNND